eukprot:1383780-Prymnesium_polylepis.1
MQGMRSHRRRGFWCEQVRWRQAHRALRGLDPGVVTQPCPRLAHALPAVMLLTPRCLDRDPCVL